MKRIDDEHSKALSQHDIIVFTEIGVRSVEEFLTGEGVRSHTGIGPILREGFTWFVYPRTWLHHKAKSGSGGVAVGIRESIAHAGASCR
jgi:hypothetical protein